MIFIGENSSLYQKLKPMLGEHVARSHRQLGDLSDSDIIFASFVKNPEDFEQYLQLIDDVDRRSSPEFKRVFISTAGLNGVPAKLVERYSYLRMKRACENILIRRGWVIVRLGSLINEDELSGDWLLADCQFVKRLSEYADGKIYYAVRAKSFSQPLDSVSRFFNYLFIKFAFWDRLNFICLIIHALSRRQTNRGYTYLSNTIGFAKVSVGAGLSTVGQELQTPFFIVPPPSKITEVINEPSAVSFSKRTSGFGSRWHGVVGSVESELDNNIFGAKAIFQPLSNPLIVFSSIILRTKNALRRFIVIEALEIQESLDGIVISDSDNAVFVNSAVINAGIFETVRLLASCKKEPTQANFVTQLVFSVGDFELSQLSKRQPIFGKKLAWKVYDEDQFLITIRPPLPDALTNTLVFGSTRERLCALFCNLDEQLIKWLAYSKLSVGSLRGNRLIIDVQFPISQEALFTENQISIENVAQAVFRRAMQIEELIATHVPGIKKVREPFDALHVTSATELKLICEGISPHLKERLSVGPAHRLFGLYTCEYTSHLLLNYAEVKLCSL